MKRLVCFLVSGIMAWLLVVAIAKPDHIRPSDNVTLYGQTVYLDGNTAVPDSMRIRTYHNGSEVFDLWFTIDSSSCDTAGAFLLWSDIFSDIDGSGGDGQYLVAVDAYDADSTLYTPRTWTFTVGLLPDSSDIYAAVAGYAADSSLLRGDSTQSPVFRSVKIYGDNGPNGSFYVYNGTGPGTRFATGAAGSYGFAATGNVSGSGGFYTYSPDLYGTRFSGGTSGIGCLINGGGSSGDALSLNTAGGHALRLDCAGAAAHGVYITTTDGHGMYVLASGSTRAGAYFRGGTNGMGFAALGQGIGSGFSATGGTGGGHGMSLAGNGGGRDLYGQIVMVPDDTTASGYQTVTLDDSTAFQGSASGLTPRQIVDTILAVAATDTVPGSALAEIIRNLNIASDTSLFASEATILSEIDSLSAKVDTQVILSGYGFGLNGIYDKSSDLDVLYVRVGTDTVGIISNYHPGGSPGDDPDSSKVTRF